MAGEDLEVKIGADIKKLLAALNVAKKRLKTFQTSVSNFSSKMKSTGRAMSSFGRSMSTYVTLPMVIAGAAAVMMASDFDESMTKIKSLVGIASEEVDQMGVVVKKMAKDVGASSRDAADALFFITSAGIKGAEAMEVLEASLKASAVGLGDAKTVADLATSAMNAYGSEVLSASAATDVMLASVREGKLAPDELAQSMGRVLPLASKLGVEFHELGATFASLSRTGTDAAEASSQISGIFSALLTATPQATKALEGMGLSFSGLRKELKEKGLISFLNTLKVAFEGNEEAASSVFGNVRALRAILDLTGSNVESTREIFQKMTNTLGDTDRAFEEVQKSASFKLKKSINDIKEVFSDLGAVLLPIIVPVLKKLATYIKNIAIAFDELEPFAKKVILAIGGLAIALPPLIALFGGLIGTVIPALITGFGYLFTAISSATTAVYGLTTAMLANPIGLVVALIAAAGVAVSKLLQYLTDAGSAWKTFTNLLKSYGNISRFINLQILDNIADQKKAYDESEKKDIERRRGGRERHIEELNEVLALTKAMKEKLSVKPKRKRPVATSIKGTASGIDENGMDKTSSLVPLTMSEDEESFLHHLGVMKQGLADFNEGANELIQGSIANTFMGLGQAIGEAMANGGNVFEAIGRGIISSIGNFLAEMGGMLIKYGTLAVLKGKLDLAILAGGPVAIGAGIAAIGLGTLLVAAGSAIGAFASKGSSSDASSYSGSASSTSTRGSSSSYSSSGGGGGTYVFEIQGTKLVGVLKNTLNRNKSLGGSLSLA
ncbi:phage tail tape measure protein [bacterium]|nr:phage tail tape measure protein [bacterium]